MHDFLKVKSLKGIEEIVKSPEVVIRDHLGGFTADFKNDILSELNAQSKLQNKILEVHTEYIFNDAVRNLYPNLNLRFNLDIHKRWINQFRNYKHHPSRLFSNFLCSFNGSEHVSRKLLIAILKKFNWCVPGYCTKNFKFTVDNLDGHITNFVGERDKILRKFFISDKSEDFFQSTFGIEYTENLYTHYLNIKTLEKPLTESFVHLVSETKAESYYPFYGEKIFYSIVTRGLFVAYAQPNFHSMLESYYGFRLYTKIFDYAFDQIQNPVDRLIGLISMLAKFQYLTAADWADLYNVEKETIDYNYNHYHSGGYLTYLRQHHG